MRLDAIRGFVFDLDGTLVQRGADGPRVIPGAREVLGAVRASGRPLVVFTNASHVAPAHIAAELRERGLHVGDDEVLTPICSALTHLRRRHPGAAVLGFVSDATRERMAAAGVRLVHGEDAEHADVVLVAHVDELAMAELERAARAIVRGARLYTASYVPAYSGADGPIFSRGAMMTAALAKATGARPVVVGKPSRAAVREATQRLGVPSRDVAVVGDDVGLEIALGHLGGWHTILVRSGISGGLDPAGLPRTRRPHAVVDGVRDLLAAL
jgi:5'-nucleotidase